MVAPPRGNRPISPAQVGGGAQRDASPFPWYLCSSYVYRLTAVQKVSPVCESDLPSNLHSEAWLQAIPEHWV